MQTTITFQDHHLAVLMAALEAFQRAKIGQFKTALENIFPIESSRLGYDALQECEDLLKSKYFPEYGRHAGPGICNKEVGKDTHLAYEMYKVIEQYRSLKHSDGWFGSTVDFDGNILNPSGLPPPKIDGLAEMQYKDFLIPDQDAAAVFFEEKDYERLWHLIGKTMLELPRGEKMEIVYVDENNGQWNEFPKYHVRVHKPRKP